MSAEIDKLRRLLAKEQSLREEEQRLRREDRENLAEEQRLRREDQEKTSKTSLPTFLDGLHHHLFLGLEVQQDKTQSTRGDPANATNKLRPRKLKAWDSFAKEQQEIWRLLMDSSLVEKRLFTSLHTLKETGESIRRQFVGSELDLNHFLRQTVEEHVSKIIEELYEDEPSKARFRRVIAGLLVQSYDYMVRAGTEMGVLSTGEADIYLRIGEEPGTLLYHLSVSKGDVGEFTGWDPYLGGPNRLHLTSVGQSLAFTLQALKLRPRNQAWSISDEEVPSSEYRPLWTNGFLRMSPIQLRRRRNNSSLGACQSSDTKRDADDDHPDPDTPSRDPRNYRDIGRRKPSATHLAPTAATDRSSGENRRYYCTLKCLRGMVNGGELDQTCPNVLDHGKTRHVINARVFVKRLQRQLSETVNADCEGIYIPLYLGSIDLAYPYSYDGIAYLKHMMLLSPGGQPLDLALREMRQDSLIAKMKESLSQMHRLDVVHKDPAPRNWLYNPESNKVVFFDFERAEILNLRPILGAISPNRKRKCISRDGFDKALSETRFTREINRAVQELRGWKH
ncbi:hypothetical protein MYU51_006495 [Penicillium brevicompactum]